MDNVATTAQNRFKSYGALAGSVAAGIAVVLTALVDYKMGVDPYARPGAFTNRDGAELQHQINAITVEHERFADEIKELKTYIADVQEYIEKHEEWGEGLALKDAEWRGKFDADHMQFRKEIERIQQQLDYLTGRRGYMDIR